MYASISDCFNPLCHRRLHTLCNTRLISQHRAKRAKDRRAEGPSFAELDGQAYEALFTAMRQSREKGDSEFLLRELWGFFMGKRNEVGIEREASSTQVKDRILKEFGEEIIAERQGSHIILYFKD